MLSYDSLVDEAKHRGMPEAKLRGAAREYLQVLALKALYSLKHSEGLVFLGGTALRLGYGLPRFSEDLDFDAEGLSFGEWKGLLENTGHALTRHGLAAQVRASEKGGLLLGDIRVLGFLQAYRLAEGRSEKLKVKIEANRPDYPMEREPKAVSGYGEMFAVPFAAPSLMAAEKILALLSRELGRDVYDLFFMAGKKWKPDGRILAARDFKTPLREALLTRIEDWGAARLAQMARRLEPFLFEPAQAKLVAEARSLLPSALEYLS